MLMRSTLSAHCLHCLHRRSYCIGCRRSAPSSPVASSPEAMAAHWCCAFTQHTISTPSGVSHRRLCLPPQRTSRTMPCPALAVFELFDAALRRQHGPVFDSQVESHCACRLQDARQVWILPAALVWSTCACPRCATRHLIACMPRV